MTHSPVSRTVTCKKCGSTNTAWRKSAKTGKWYLVEVFIVDGTEQADPRDFHSIYCGNSKLHDEAQALLANDEDDDQDYDEPPETEQADEREIEMLALLAGYDPMQREDQIGQMKFQLASAVARGEDPSKCVKLRELIDLAIDFVDELED